MKMPPHRPLALALLAVAGFGVTLPLVRAQEAPASAPANGSNVTADGTLVSLDVDNVPLREAAAKVFDQSGVRMLFHPGDAGGADSLVSLKAANRPVMEVIKDLADAAGKKHPISFSMEMGSRSQVPIDGRLSAKGPFLIVAQELSHLADYRRPDGQEESFALKAALVIDPAFHPVIVPTRVPAGTAGEATDEKGSSLVPVVLPPSPDKATVINVLAGETVSFPIDILLSRPRYAGAVIKKLSGTFPVTVADKSETLEFKAASEQTKTIDGVKATFTLAPASDRSGAHEWALSYQFDRPAGMTDDQWAARTKVFAATRLWVESADGRHWDSRSASGQTGDSVRQESIRFGPMDSRGPGNVELDFARAVIEVVVTTKRIDAEYSFEYLPLP